MNTLEIGVGGQNFFVMPTMLMEQADGSVPRRFFGDDCYIACDMAEQQEHYWFNPFVSWEPSRPVPTKEDEDRVVSRFAEATKKFRERDPNEHISFVVADGGVLPARDATFDEVYCANVFSSELYTSAAVRILKEVRRVLKPDGCFVIREDYTPSKADEDLAETIQSIGFNADKIAYGSAAYVSLVKQYGDSFAYDPTKLEYFVNDRFMIEARPVVTDLLRS